MEKAAKNIYTSIRMKYLLRVLIAVLNLVLFAFPVHGKEPVRIGVLANLGKETAVRMWAPTADYLTTRIPQHSFAIIPLSFDEINRAVERKEVDFVLTNPGIYVELEYTRGVTRIATLDVLWNGKVYNSYGGVIFTRADRRDINELRDLKGKAFIAVHETSYGGWRAALRELKAGGIDPWRHFSRLLFSGESQEQAVFAVRDGKADAGTVRTGILELMAVEGRIRLGDFKILNPQKVEDFPLLLSTRLYPEWAFGRLRHTPDMLARKVAAALLDMPADSPAAKAGKIAGFTVPLDYQPVHQLMKELRLNPYKDYGKLTLGQALKRYWPGILMLFVITFFLGYTTLYLLKLKKEIAERKKAEEALKENEQKFRQIAENIREVFWITDPEKNRMLYISPAYEAIWGQTCKSLYAEPRNWLEAIHPDDRDRILASATTKQVSGEYDEEYRIIRPDGAVRWISDKAFPVKDEKGSIYRIAGIAEDITERKQAEESLQRNEQLLRLFVEHSPAAIAMLDLNMKYIIASRRWFADYDLGDQDVAGRSHYDVFPEISERWKEIHRRCMAGAVERSEEDQFVRADGSIDWVRWEIHPWYHSTNEIGGIIIFSEVITWRKKAEERISRLSRLYSVLSKINEAIVRTKEPEELYRQACSIIVEVGGFRMAWIGIIDPDTLLVIPVAVCGHEDSYLKKKRISIDERIPEGRGPTGIAVRTGGYYICNDIENDPVMAPWRDEALKRGYRSSAAFALKAGTRVVGSINLYSGEASFFHNEEGEETQLLLSLAEDISYAIESIEIEKQRIKAEHELQMLTIELEGRVKERTAELKDSQMALMNIVDDLNNKTEELEQANVKLMDLDRMKSMFIATMSHELRTPLNSIIGFSSILHDGWIGQVNAEQKENLATILRSGKHLLSLINDVIDVSKIESGKIEVSYADFDIYDVISEAVELFKKDVQDKGLALNVEPIHLAMHTDRRRLLQSVVNLISNAVKFTERGSVRVAVRRIQNPESRIQNKEYVEISVEDTGIGIKEEDIPKLFGSFVRLHSPLSTTAKGTGLGLYLTKKIVTDILKGEITVESEYGKGSRFTIRIPVKCEKGAEDEESTGNRRQSG